MRAVVQRVTEASVTVDGSVTGHIGTGLLVLLGVTHDDNTVAAERMAAKIWGLRIMRDEQSASDIDAPILAISQFTVYGDARKGRRPTWVAAAPGDVAQPLYDTFCSSLRQLGATVAEGVFGADMTVSSTNDGPTTLIVEI